MICTVPLCYFGTSFSEHYEHNVDNVAFEVFGQDWSSGGLGGSAGGIELPQGNGLSLPRNEGCVLGELREVGSPLSQFSGQDGNRC